MSHDDTCGFLLTDSADSSSSGDACVGGRIGANSRTMTGNDLGGRSLVQARVQAQVQAGVQGVAEKRLPIGGADRPSGGGHPLEDFPLGPIHHAAGLPTSGSIQMRLIAGTPGL